MCHEVAVLAVSDIWVRGTSALRRRAGWRRCRMFPVSYVSDALSDSGHLSNDGDNAFGGTQLPQATWSIRAVCCVPLVPA